MFKSEHRHRGIKERHLQEGYRNVFKPENHSRSSLARHVVAFSKLRGSAMTRRQAKAMHSFHKEEIFDLSDKESKFSDMDILEEYCYLFDDLFFFGSLKNHVKFELGKPDAAVVAPGTSAIKDESKKRSINRRGMIFYLKVEKQCRIIVYPPPKNQRRSERLLIFLSKILHSLTHAFLIIWGCHHKKCEHDCKCLTF